MRNSSAVMSNFSGRSRPAADPVSVAAVGLARHKLLIVVVHGVRFMIEMPAKCGSKAFMGYPVGGKGACRHEPARNLVFALRAGLETLQPVTDTVVDARVIAYFEVQAVIVFITAPVPAVERVIADKADGSGDDTGSGFVVEGDKRRLSHGFGHISAATPIVVNSHIYFSTVLGTVYVVDATTERFDENSLVSVNDLGLPGETWTLSPFTAAGGHLYQRTSREIICIGDGR